MCGAAHCARDLACVASCRKPWTLILRWAGTGGQPARGNGGRAQGSGDQVGEGGVGARSQLWVCARHGRRRYGSGSAAASPAQSRPWRAPASTREVVVGGRVGLDQRLLPQLHDRDRRDRLGDRGDAEDGCPHRPACPTRRRRRRARETTPAIHRGPPRPPGRRPASGSGPRQPWPASRHQRSARCSTCAPLASSTGSRHQRASAARLRDQPPPASWASGCTARSARRPARGTSSGRGSRG